MQQGSIYRITVKANGFVPDLYLLDHASALVGSSTGLPSMNPNATPWPKAAPRRGTAQMVFTPTATQDHQIKVDYAPGTDLAQGPLRYTLTVERAGFLPHLAVKDPHLEVTEHARRLEKGKLYGITVTGRGFAPEVQIMDGAWPMAQASSGRWFGFGPDAECENTLTFAPAKTTEYRILVGVGPRAEQRTAPLTYTTRLVELKVALWVQERLTYQDRAYAPRGGPHKVHSAKLEAGKTYQVDMMSRAFAAQVVLEDSAGSVLLPDDDRSEGKNARIIFRPAKTDTYRIVATTLLPSVPGRTLGPYTLTVAENPDAQPRLGSPALSGRAVPDFAK
jgi:hypothetical protein